LAAITFLCFSALNLAFIWLCHNVVRSINIVSNKWLENRKQMLFTEGFDFHRSHQLVMDRGNIDKLNAVPGADGWDTVRFLNGWKERVSQYRADFDAYIKGVDNPPGTTATDEKVNGHSPDNKTLH
jgi:hypothetical protein